MTPGATTWPEAVPAVAVAAILLFVPGAVALRLLGARWWVALGVGPAVGTTLFVAAGVLCGAAHIPWGLLPVVGATLVGWTAAALLGLVLRRRARTSGAIPPVDTRSLDRWSALAGLAGVAFAFASVLVVMVNVTGTPDHFPQHPDTIFHLGDARWMTEHRDVSLVHAYGFVNPGSGSLYPAAFHLVTATTSLLTGANVVVSTQSAVLVMAGLVWPAGVILLARALLGPRPEVVGSAAVASVMFTAFPYTIMGFGVLWPNLFGQALLPGVVATAMAALARFVPHRDPVLPVLPAVLVTVFAVPGLTTAHPNALVTLLVLGLVAVSAAGLHAAWDARRRPGRAVLWVLGVGVLVVASALASWAVRSPSMFRTGAAGGEAPFRQALTDTVFFGPRHALSQHLLTVAVLVGALWLSRRHRGAGWVPVAALAFAGLYLLNVVVDDQTARWFTWPWYNNAIRLAVAGSLPAVMCATAGFVAVGTGLASLASRVLGPRGHSLQSKWRGTTIVTVATVLVSAAFVGVTKGYVHAHDAFLRPFYHPNASHSWASDKEIRALTSLAAHIPPDAITAANAWNGGTYLYVVSGRRLLVPTEKALTTDDRKLLAWRLNEVGASPQVCDAARRQHVEYAIVGGRPFAWATAARVASYRGIDRVGSSPAFTKVATASPYTLYRLTRCAGS
ncbi:DUF6541 family protein [Pedococcus sp. KACC 23699]|uniref:DUF6541 family protein n=1 Tax=Pedococcus sp. KACC 23699 TaxID=3149228 RepID=A0AAU7JVS5_9MICO